MRIIAIMFLALLAISAVSADVSTYTNQSSQLWFSSSCAQPNVTIVAPNTSVVVSNQQLTAATAPFFFFQFNASQVGNYYVSSTCTNTSAFMLSSVPNIPQATVEALDMIFQSFLLFCIGILLIVVGEYLRNHLLTLLAGVWFLGISTTIAFTGFANSLGTITFTFFVLMGLAVLFHGISRLVQEATERKRKRLEGDE